MSRVIVQVRPGDLIGENARQHTSLTYQKDDETVMTVFQSLLNQLVQSNSIIMNNEVRGCAAGGL